MILYIDLEHKALAKRKLHYYTQIQQKRERTRNELSHIAQMTCRLIHYTEFKFQRERFNGVSLIVVSGHNTDIQDYTPSDLEPLRECFRKPPCPVFTICGSFQLMVQTLGGSIGPIGAAQEASIKGPDPILPDNMLQENGYCTIELLVNAPPPFNHLRKQSTMLQHHYWEIKSLPSSFIHCAHSEITQFQAAIHRHSQLCGVQFHPEEYNSDHSDGLRLLQSIVEWAGLRRVNGS